jgi:hypothetical protein
MATVCPGCGAPASGKFCSQCGTPLDTHVRCARCGNTIPEGGRFCNMCGASVIAAEPAGSVAQPSKRENPNLPWYIAGAALLALAAALIGPRLSSSPDPVATSAPPITGPIGDPRAVDLASMTPREAADSLFNRVMRAASAGDSTQARMFAPMGISAYTMAEPLDLDGRYHVAVLHLVNGDPASARRVTEEMLAEVPNHLFALGTAAESEVLLGNADAASVLYQQLLDNYDAELATGRVEYGEHTAVLPAMREQAERFIAGN